MKKQTRVDESRDVLRRMMDISLGSYMEQEAKKQDQWRDQTFGQLYAHLKHEVVEIARSNDKTKQVHNCMDAVSLSAMLLQKAMEE